MKIPSLKIFLCLGPGFLPRQRFRLGKRMPRGFIEDLAIASDVDEEGSAACQLIVDVREAVHDRDDRRVDMVGDLRLDEPFVESEPKIVFLGKAFVIDDDQKIIVGTIAAGAILDPIAAAIRTVKDDLQDLAAGLAIGLIGRLKVCTSSNRISSTRASSRLLLAGKWSSVSVNVKAASKSSPGIVSILTARC